MFRLKHVSHRISDSTSNIACSSCLDMVDVCISFGTYGNANICLQCLGEAAYILTEIAKSEEVPF